MNEVRQPLANAVCQDCTQEWNARTMYVHLCSGKVTEVTGVTEVEVTQEQVIFNREEDEPAVFPRRDVYFACCDRDEQPSPF